MESKWKSRKFWVAVSGVVVGIVTAIWGGVAGGQVETIAGIIIAALVSLGYLAAEAVVDAARARAEVDMESIRMHYDFAKSGSKKK